MIDCPDPRALARFYAGVGGGTPEEDDPMGVPPLERSREWGRVVLQLPGGPRLAFQPAPGQAQDKDDFRVYADPAGHPFCLCRIEPT
ncbi:VOC family protein [Streptomyces sp. NPDC049627]|uniref:VOC family protein n=1 Tax=Streptomyces sp. NPDC049627 TaxID=3365595 RepID=UPI0037BACAA6